MITPWSFLDLNGSIFDGHDKYPASYFGLKDNKNRGYSVGFDLVPNETVNFGVSYGFEKDRRFSGRARRIRRRPTPACPSSSTIHAATGRSTPTTETTPSR